MSMPPFLLIDILLGFMENFAGGDDAMYDCRETATVQT